MLQCLIMQCKPVSQLMLLTLNARIWCVSNHIFERSLMLLEGLPLPPQGENSQLRLARLKR